MLAKNQVPWRAILIWQNIPTKPTLLPSLTETAVEPMTSASPTPTAPTSPNPNSRPRCRALSETAPCLLLLAALSLSGCGKGVAEKPSVNRDESIPVQVARVESVEMDRTISVVGTLAARSEALV